MVKQLSEPVQSSREMLLKRFRDLKEYLCLLGEHVNLVHSSIERIEKNISEMQSQQMSALEQTQKELQQIREVMVVRSEVDSLLRDLNEAVKGTFPSILSSVPDPLRGTIEEHIGTIP